ncbi:MAG: GAF domain-containing protein, partial [Desulfatibacillum sp.]|nr:GAF domain-containing protein [Desulfatibacillum sp.]
MDENHADTAREKEAGVLGMIFRRGLSRTLVAWFLFLALVPLALINAISYRQARNSLQDSAIISLETTANLKTHFINNWFTEHFLNLRAQATSLENTRFLAELRQAFKASGKEAGEFTKSYAWTALIGKHAADFKSLRNIFGYHDVFLIDSDGNILFSVAGESDLGTNLFSGEYSGTRFADACRKALETGRPAFSDLELYAPSNNEVAGFVADVIVDEAGDKIGVLALQIPIEAINAIMHERTGLGKTGETHLIGPDKMLRSDCAFNPESKALKTQIDTEQVRLWLEEHGKEGAQEADDIEEPAIIYPGPHDGRSVLGIHQSIHIADTHWAVMAEIEESEVFADARSLGMLTLILVGGTALLVFLLSISVARRIVRPLLALSDTTRSVAAGNFDQEISVNVRNEIGDLAANFRVMLLALGEATSASEAEDWLKTGQAGLSDATRGEQDLPTLGRNVITFLAKYLDARIGAFYMVSDAGILKLVGSYAYTLRKGLSNEYRIGEGLVGQAALEKETIVLTDVPDDYIKVRSGVGSAGPTSIVVMPVLDNGELKGVVELGAFRDLGERELRLLHQVAEIIGVTISTAQSR